MQRSKSLALMFLLGALLVGGALGFTADRLFVGGRLSPSTSDRVSMRDELATHLQLSAAQRAAFDSILDKRHDDMGRVLATIRPQMDSLRHAARAQMVSRLDARQRLRFQEFIDRKNAEKKSDEKRRQESGSR